VDAFGHPYHASPAAALARLAATELGLRARFEKPGTIARMSAALASPVDREEAHALGLAAARHAGRGDGDLMVTLVREADDPYAWRIGSAPLAEVANAARPLPDAFIAPDGRAVTDAFRRYALPLLGPDPFPVYGRVGGSPRPPRPPV
jgi:6-phosphofructokinase 1